MQTADAGHLWFFEDLKTCSTNSSRNSWMRAHGVKLLKLFLLTPSPYLPYLPCEPRDEHELTVAVDIEFGILNVELYDSICNMYLMILCFVDYIICYQKFQVSEE